MAAAAAAAAETKKRKGSINEEDVSTLLHRYNATTILALLQEVSQFAGVRIDWSTLVKKTSTGITSAREYQMLWRHLAYRDTLMVKVEDSAEPLDDDSDLEFDLEAVPAISAESSSEAAACVKVLISSGLQRETCPTGRSTVEAPLTINIPTEHTSLMPSDKSQPNRYTSGLNITVPVSIPKQLTPTGPSADLDGNQLIGSGLPPKKKRRLWTEEEEKELVDAVQKFGEGNWSGILKGNFKHKLQNRTASQMSQRYAAIRKRQGNPKPITTNKSHNSTRSEEMLAAQKALSLAIDMPMTRNFSSLFSGNTPSYTPATATISSVVPEAQPCSGQLPNQPQQALNPSTSKKVASNPPNKPTATHPSSETQPVSAQLPQHSQSHQASNPTTSKIGASNPSNKPITTPPLSDAQPISVLNQSQQTLNLATFKKVASNPSSKPSATPLMSEAQPFSAQAPNKPQHALDVTTSKKVVSNPSNKPGTTPPSSEVHHVSAQVPPQSQALNLATLRKGVSNPFNKPRPALKKQIAPSLPSATPVMPLPPSSTTVPSPPPTTPPPVVPSPPPTTPPPVVPAAPPLTPTAAALVPSTPPMPPACSGSSIQAAALAAGGRLATPSTAASLLKAANSKSAVRIPPLGSPLAKAQGMGGNMSPVLKQATKARRTQLIANPSASKARRTAGKPASFSTSSALTSKSAQLHIGDVQETGGPMTGDVTGDVSAATDIDEVELDGSMDQDTQKSLGF